MARRRALSVMPHKERIRDLRRRHGWTHEGLAKRIGYSTRSIERVEREGVRVSLPLLRGLADALEVEIDELMVPDFLGGDDPESWLRKAIDQDLRGNFGSAVDIARAIHKSGELGQTAVVRLASFLDHAGEWETALRLLDGQLKVVDEDSSEPVHGQIAWVLYQRGLIRRRLAEDFLRRSGGRRTARIEQLLRSAKAGLVRVQRSPEADQAAPLHQLGALQMLDGNFEGALRSFEHSLRLRQKRHSQAPAEHGELYRQGYTYRRMGQCHAAMNRDADARVCLERAWRIALETGHRRLLKEVARDLDTWGLRGRDA